MKKRILTADDEMDVLMLLETRLSASGYEVLKATDGIAVLPAPAPISPRWRCSM